MKHKYEHKKFLICWNMTLAAVTEISLLISSQHREAQHWELHSSCIFHLLHPLISSFSELCPLRGPNFLPWCVKSSCAINRPTLEKLQSLSCLARSTGIYPQYSPENHKTSTRKQSFSTVEHQSVTSNEQTVQPGRTSPLWLCFRRNLWCLLCTGGVFTVTWRNTISQTYFRHLNNATSARSEDHSSKPVCPFHLKWITQ